MYLDDIARVIRSHIRDEDMPSQTGDADQLFHLYAVLLLAKGKSVTDSDIHDAWAAWMSTRDAQHQSLRPFGELPEDVQKQDHVFTMAVRKAAKELGVEDGSHSPFSDLLFPYGPPTTDGDAQQVFDLYKIMVDSSESLVSRRQAVNTFFVTLNLALFTAFGIIIKSTSGDGFVGWGIFILAVSGIMLSWVWGSLIKSFGQLNTGKFKVINSIEKYLKVGLYAAEWEALGRGEDPEIYRSFTSREK